MNSGMYYSSYTDIRVSSKRSTVQTICLVQQKDIDTFGLNLCIKEEIQDLRTLVEQGIYDEKTKTNLQVRVIACLGDNLGQNEVAGMRLNFSKLMHACRRCLCSRIALCNAESYSDIHAKNHPH